MPLNVFPLILAVLLTHSSLASLRVSLDRTQHTATLEMQINFYGAEAQRIAPIAMKEIADLWMKTPLVFPPTSPLAGYQIRWAVKGRILSEEQIDTLLARNTDYRQNFIRLEKGSLQKESFVLSNGANCGTWYSTQGIGKSLTAAHEFGHLLGLAHLNPNTQRGRGDKISIMSTRLTEADPQFCNANDQLFGYKNKLNIQFRKVTESDLMNLSTVIVAASQNNQALVFNVGKIPNFAFNSMGEPR